jgi:cap1 methyltransferase
VKEENAQELLSAQILLSQVYVALSVVRAGKCKKSIRRALSTPNSSNTCRISGGHFVCKLFDVFTPFSVGLLYLLYVCFERITLHKPLTSRPANSERYVICKGRLAEGSVSVGSVEATAEYLASSHRLLFAKGTTVDTHIIHLVPLKLITDCNSAFCQFIRKSNNQ